MSGLLLYNGQLAWPFFAALVYTAITILATDVLWRMVKMSTRRLLLPVTAVWAVGMLLILIFL